MCVSCAALLRRSMRRYSVKRNSLPLSLFIIPASKRHASCRASCSRLIIAKSSRFELSEHLPGKAEREVDACTCKMPPVQYLRHGTILSRRPFAELSYAS
ncbi:unnamed protein product [Mycena citricolor]|uniref:Uncharacterized protein n=1 Tax=Mycena citricolor TaxID=2018698 RepID=A0AAD2H3S6_9AGAR|nr:unnamed protein product [Mycena citricolor]